MTYEPKPHEQIFNIKPIGVRYICEHCNEGEMTVVNEEVKLGFDLPFLTAPMRKHRCNKCKGELMLPKAYPYVEWIKEGDEGVQEK